MRDFFDIQNDAFFDFLNRTFEFSKCKNWKEIADKVTVNKVKETYQIFAKLYPRNHDYSKELEKMQSTFSSIHYGNLKANKIIDEVVKFSLYTDKIVVFHPIQNPSITSQAMDPRSNPRLWMGDFLDSLYFYIVIQRWVKAGIIKLIINPWEYDFKLRDVIDQQAQDRMSKTDMEKVFQETKHILEDNLAEQLAVFSDKLNKTQIVENLLSMSNPKFTPELAESYAEKIVTAFPRVNPIYNNINLNLLGKKGTINSTRGGGPVESILHLSKITKANIYTPSNLNWNQLKDMGVNDFWLKTNKLYSEIPLTFLNNVDTNFALKIREEDRLSGVRQELKKIYKDLSSINITDLNENNIKFLQEGFIEELKKSESEWKLIKKQANTSRAQWLTANVGIPVIINEISFLPLAIASVAWLYKNEKDAKDKIENYKIKNPISVFVDLKNQNQTFFSELKNCLI